MTVTTSQAAPAGSAIVVAAVAYGVSPSSASCSDSAGNVYATDVTNSSLDGLTTICSAHAIATQLPAGATITVAWTGGGPPWNERASAWSISNLAAVPLDQTASATGTSDSPSSGLTAATAQPNELLFGVIADLSDTVGSAGFSPGTNGTAGNCANTGTPTYGSLGGTGTGKSSPAIFATYCIVSAKAAYQATGSLPLSPEWQALLATYKGTNP